MAVRRSGVRDSLIPPRADSDSGKHWTLALSRSGFNSQSVHQFPTRQYIGSNAPMYEVKQSFSVHYSSGYFAQALPSSERNLISENDYEV